LLALLNYTLNIESKLALLIGLIVIFFIFGTVVVFSLKNQAASQSCGGVDSIGCPFGFRCQITNDQESVGECINLIGQFQKWIYSVAPQLKPKAEFVCPQGEWVDCMPGPDISRPECSTEYLNWAKINCPNFRGAAL
jgi:hypothetical protein